MKKSAILFLILSVALGSYGYWGMFTKGGLQKYEEMAGMIPFFPQGESDHAFITSVLLFWCKRNLSEVLRVTRFACTNLKKWEETLKGNTKGLPKPVAAILALEPDKRTPAHRKLLADHYRTLAPELAVIRSVRSAFAGSVLADLATLESD